MPGRPSLYTAARADAIIEAIRCGETIKSACAAAGVNPVTLRNWVAKHKGLAKRVADARADGVRAVAEKGSAKIGSARSNGKDAPAEQDILVRVTWELTPRGLAKLAEFVSHLDRSGALANTVRAILPTRSAQIDFSTILDALRSLSSK